MGNLRLVLASSSPRRKELLKKLGLPFQVRQPPETVEASVPAAKDFMRELSHIAIRKAQSVAKPGEDEVILAADTIVEIDGRLLGKPASPANALKMLQKLRGRWHRVHTAVCVFHPAQNILKTHVETTRVKMGNPSDSLLGWYVETGEPMDKAGAYAVQGRGALLIEKVEGCFFNVVGLPLYQVYLLLKSVAPALLPESQSLPPSEERGEPDDNG